MDNASLRKARISDSQRRGIFTSAVFGMLSGVLFSLAFVAVMSLIAYKNPDPTALILPFSYICMIVCAFVCGCSGARFRGSGGFLCGLMSGCMFSLLLFVISQFFSGDGTLPTSVVLFCYICMILVSSLGALFGARKKKQKRRRRR
jgi:putative membrane protein (TIGR04086 family)